MLGRRFDIQSRGFRDFLIGVVYKLTMYGDTQPLIKLLNIVAYEDREKFVTKFLVYWIDFRESQKVIPVANRREFSYQELVDLLNNLTNINFNSILELTSREWMSQEEAGILVRVIFEAAGDRIDFDRLLDSPKIGSYIKRPILKIIENQI